MKVKRVLAQRKFAQGVYVPTSTADKRNEPPSSQTRPGVEKPQKVTRFNMNATQYLDFVSFQNLHHHEETDSSSDTEATLNIIVTPDLHSQEPVHIQQVSNLEINSNDPLVMLNKLNMETILVDKTIDNHEKHHNEDVIGHLQKKQKKTTKKKIVQKNNTKCARTRLQSSALGASRTTESNSSNKNVRVRKRRAPKTNARDVKKKIPNSVYLDISSDDDDTPLKTLCEVKANKRKLEELAYVAEEKKSSPEPETTRPIRKSARKSKTIDYDAMDAIYDLNDMPDWDNEPVYKSAPLTIISVTKADDSPVKEIDDICIELRSPTPTPPLNEIDETLIHFEDDDINNSIIDESMEISVIKENPVNMYEVDQPVILSDLTVQLCPIEMTENADDSTDDSGMFKVPLPVNSTRYKRKSIGKPTSQCPSSCPSNKIDSMYTHSIPLDSWHKVCKNCHILTKIRNKMNNMVKEKNESAEDVYMFRCEQENDDEALINYRHHTRTQIEPNSIYVDLFEDNLPFIINIMNDKDMLSARILRRSDVDPQLLKKASGDITSPIFLNEILSYLNTSDAGDAKEKEDNARNTFIDKTIGYKKKENKHINVFPKPSQKAVMVEAPVYRPTTAEFENPLVYIESIRAEAEKFGICKIVPPAEFKPTFNVIPEDLNFMSSNQYICKMYLRWASSTREISAIKAYLATQNVVFRRPPLIDGIEVNLGKLYHRVQRMGGLKEVIEKKKWMRVAEEMNYNKTSNIETKLDKIYCKYLLPYDTLSSKERQEITRLVEIDWNLRFNKMLFRARHPLHRQQKILGEATSEDEDEEELTGLDEIEDCVLPGRYMNVKTFKNIAQRSMEVHFPTNPNPTTSEVENAYWEYVLFGREHICVNTASIDTGERSFGFTKNKGDPYSKHPWNLKVLSNNPGSVLRSMGPVLSATVPALHLGMVFTTSCWHRDPHGLPWIEYLHEGPPKIWYGIPNDWSDNFRKAVETLAPAYCQNKAIWLPSDIAMFPPKLLIDNNVALSKTIQEAGEYIVVFPKAYSSSICTGYSISESVYFAPHSWLMTMQNDFQEVRDSCEPTMFSLEHLLISIANDPKSPQAVKIQIHNSLDIIIRDEIENRYALEKLGVLVNVNKQPPKKKSFFHSWNVGDHTECDICRRTLFLSKVSGITGKKSDLCLQHAVRILEMHSVDQIAEMKKDINVVCFYSEESLDELMRSLRTSII